ncbi:MAG: hypothetical protein KIT33_10520 [Candidatus Kapabacteria bacterium]|nr:hypothetical protein [Ignavibacteriota bacterium]MCW5885393.1 hypothetical protein [Candidatus Kapabacteria bacterium]
MKKYLIIIVLAIVYLGVYTPNLKSQVIDREGIIDSLTTIDPEIVSYFPRWKICEPDLMTQIYAAFVYKGYPKSNLSREDIEVLAAPKEYPADPFEILMLKCGRESMNSVEIQSTMSSLLIGFLSGELQYQGLDKGFQHPDNRIKRDYCFSEVPREIPVTPSQADIIVSYIERPTNVDHSFSLSLFEQNLKVGETGFWIRSIMGTDQVGLPFWTAGESKILLQRPLYINQDPNTRKGIPYLINAYLGGGYRIQTGLSNENTLLSWIPERVLNTGPGGKIIFGTDVHAWFHPEAGLSLNLELPLQSLTTETIDINTYGRIIPSERIEFDPNDPRNYPIDFVAPILRSTGQITGFYHLWLDKKNPENYFRFDLGISYSEVVEAAGYQEPTETGDITNITTSGVRGLKMYKPEEFTEWLYFKVDYRSQAAFPFGASVQISNQIFLGRLYLPLFGNWLYLEGKYSTPLRDARPYEIKNFFMISPVIRLTI